MSNLLEKEKEYHRINEELEQKTRNIMLEVDSVINSRVNSAVHTTLCKKQCSKSLENISSHTNDYKDHNINNFETNVSDINTSATSEHHNGKKKREDETLKKQAENEAVVQCLKTKVQMLHEELNLIQMEYKKQSNICREMEADSKKNEAIKKKLQNQILSLKETILKLGTSNSSLQAKFDAQKLEANALKREIDELKKELKICRNQSSTYDVRLNRCFKENENLKSTLKLNQLEEKELRDKLRKHQESSKLEVKRLEKQYSELLQAYKKQTQLADNLKKQMAYLEATKHIQWAEAEFLKLLEEKEYVK